MRRLPVTIAGLAALAFCLAVVTLDPVILRNLSAQAMDAMRRAAAVPPRTDTVAVLDVDEASLETYGQWPWPRRVLAEVVGRAWAAGARVLVFDIVFPERDRTSPALLLENWRALYGPGVALKGIPEERREHDAEFARALAGGASVLGTYVDSAGQAGVERPYEGHGFEVGPPQPGMLHPATRVIGSIPPLAAAARSEAFFNTLPDEDNIIRRTPLVMALGDRRLYPALSLEAMRLYLDAKFFRVDWDDTVGRGVKSVALGGITAPTDGNGCLVLNFRSGTFPRVSVRDLMEGRDGGVLSNRVVFVGTSAAGLGDLVSTSMGRDVPGVEVHATAFDNMYAGDALRQPRWAFHATFLAVLFAGLSLIAVMTRARALVGFFVSAACMAAAAGLSWFLLTARLLLVSPAEFVLSIGVLYTAMTVLKFRIEERERRRVRSMFGTMVSGEVLEYMEEHPESFSLVGRKVEATVFFSDIVSFTGTAERLDPQVLTRFVNRYFTPMSDAIMRRDGYVDKFNGDAIMAVWGAPNAMPDHAVQACLSALEQAERLQTLQGELQKEFGQGISIRVGINSGMMTAGNMGSERHFQYTVMGDAVNIAARLEDANKRYGTTMLIGEETWRRAKDHVEVRAMGAITIRGKQQPVRAYELLARKGGLSPVMQEVAKEYEAAVACLERGERDACLEHIGRALAAKPDDLPSIRFAERVRAG